MKTIIKEITLNFLFKQFNHTHILRPTASDYWEGFESNGLSFDVHYDEEDMTICVYEVQHDGRAITQKTIHKEKIVPGKKLFKVIRTETIVSEMLIEADSKEEAEEYASTADGEGWGKEEVRDTDFEATEIARGEAKHRIVNAID